MKSQKFSPFDAFKIQRKLIDGSHHLFMEFICLIKTPGLPLELSFNPSSDQLEPLRKDN